MGWKTKAFFIWIATEIAVLPFAIPATAQIVERIAFSIPPRVSAVQLNTEPGLEQYIVSSNSAFTIISEGAVGEIDVDVKVSGQINNVHYGNKAQNPGNLHSCALPTNELPYVIYNGERKTAAKRGKVLEQSILIEMRYDPALKPTISFEPVSELLHNATPNAQNCHSVRS